MENQRNQQGKMLDNQTANNINKYLNKKKKKENQEKKIPSSGMVEFQS
jgi:hypothetical protein